MKEESTITKDEDGYTVRVVNDRGEIVCYLKGVTFARAVYELEMAMYQNGGTSDKTEQ